MIAILNLRVFTCVADVKIVQRLMRILLNVILYILLTHNITTALHLSCGKVVSYTTSTQRC